MSCPFVPTGELDILSWITKEIRLSSDVSERLDRLVEKLNHVILFNRCVVIHQRDAKTATSGSLIYRHSGNVDSNHQAPSRSSFGSPIGIDDYILCYEKFASLDNGFSWRDTGRTPAGSCATTEDLVSHMRRGEGVAASVRSMAAGTDEVTTLLQLECAAQPVSARQTQLVGFIAFCLHSAFMLNAAGGFLQDGFREINLTGKEQDVLRWMVEGKTSWEIGKILSTSERTVKFHLKNVYAKLNVSNRAQAAAVVNRLGLI